MIFSLSIVRFKQKLLILDAILAMLFVHSRAKSVHHEISEIKQNNIVLYISRIIVWLLANRKLQNNKRYYFSTKWHSRYWKQITEIFRRRKHVIKIELFKKEGILYIYERFIIFSDKLGLYLQTRFKNGCLPAGFLWSTANFVRLGCYMVLV